MRPTPGLNPRDTTDYGNVAPLNRNLWFGDGQSSPSLTPDASRPTLTLPLPHGPGLDILTTTSTAHRRPSVLAAVAIVLLLISLVLIPFGVPGLWIMIAVIGVGVYAGEVGWSTLVVLIVAATLAEIAEFFLVKRYSERYGGSKRAFWGAIFGGLIGVLVGVPIPIVGSVIAGIIGTFLGAALVTVIETRNLPSATRVGWGVTLGRVASIAVKTATGIAILAVGIGAFLID